MPLWKSVTGGMSDGVRVSGCAVPLHRLTYTVVVQTRHSGVCPDMSNIRSRCTDTSQWRVCPDMLNTACSPERTPTVEE